MLFIHSFFKCYNFLFVYYNCRDDKYWLKLAGLDKADNSLSPIGDPRWLVSLTWYSSLASNTISSIGLSFLNINCNVMYLRDSEIPAVYFCFFSFFPVLLWENSRLLVTFYKQISFSPLGRITSHIFGKCERKTILRIKIQKNLKAKHYWGFPLDKT